MGSLSLSALFAFFFFFFLCLPDCPNWRGFAGDCFMAVGGLFDRQADHAEAVVDFSLEVQQEIAVIASERG